MSSFTPRLSEHVTEGVHALIDHGARDRGVLVGFTDRRGGVSVEPYGSLNLGLRVGDDPDAVGENRRRVARAVGFHGDDLVLARQVHGADVLEAAAGDTGVLGEGDGLVARSPGPVMGILTADCAPVVLAGERGVAVVHAGWRGLVAGVVPAGVERVGPVWGAWVGPCIRACCYEVGTEVTDAFGGAGLPVAAPRRVDPSDAAAAALAQAGVDDVVVVEECTMCTPTYFSYRRDGVTGRQGAFAGMLEG